MATLTRIFGTLYTAQGTPVIKGKITLQLQQDMASVDGTKVAPFSVSQDLAATNGFFDKSVYATVGASPGGLAYLVEFDPDPADTTKPANQKDGYWRNYWSVPNQNNILLGNFITAERGEIFTNYMPLGGVLVDPRLPDNIFLGLDPSGSDKTIVANQTAGSNPTLRFNGAASYWDFTDDGLTYRRLLGGNGTTGALIKWTGGTLSDSIATESGSTITINNTLKVSTILTPAATDLVLSPTQAIITGGDLKPDSFLSRKIGSPALQYLALYAGELIVDTIVSQESLATVGGRVLVGPTTSLTQPLGTSDQVAFLKHNQPDKDDVQFMQDSGVAEFLRILGLNIVAVDTAAEWFEIGGDYTALFTAGRTFVVRASTGNNGTWTVTSSSYDPGPVRTRIIVTGNITNATVDGYVAYLDSAGPYCYVVARHLEGGSASWNAGDALLNTGNTGDGFIDLYSVSGILSGSGPTIVGNVRTSTTYNAWEPRWAIGNLNGLYGYVTDTYGAAFGVASAAWVKIDPTNGVRLGHNATTKVQIDASGNASFTGSITAASGTIGGWSIGATALTSGSGATTVGLDSGGSNPAIYAGSATPGSAPFRVTQAGAVTATSGTIGGWTLAATSLKSGSGATTVGLDSGGTNPAIYAGNATPGSAPFRVTQAGAVTATSGAIGGWTLGATSLTAGSGATTVGIDSGGSNPAFYAGSATPGSAPFRVTQAGGVTCADLTITGGVVGGGIAISTSGSLRSGSTAFLTGTGFWLAYNAGNPQFHVGNPSGNYFAFNAATGTTTIVSNTVTVDNSGVRVTVGPNSRSNDHGFTFSGTTADFFGLYANTVWTNFGSLELVNIFTTNNQNENAIVRMHSKTHDAEAYISIEAIEGGDTGRLWFYGSTAEYFFNPPATAGTNSADVTWEVAGGWEALKHKSSDERLKTAINPLNLGMKALRQIQPIRFQWKASGTADVGFSAQNCRTVLPEAAPEQHDGYYGFKTLPMVALAVSAIKELDARVTALEKK